jgi:hypothetical protein
MNMLEKRLAERSSSSGDIPGEAFDVSGSEHEENVDVSHHDEDADSHSSTV